MRLHDFKYKTIALVLYYHILVLHLILACLCGKAHWRPECLFLISGMDNNDNISTYLYHDQE